jgi:hypothetical protein
MEPKFYRFTIVHHGFALVLRLNDVIIDADPKGIFRNRKFVNNQFILDGKNTLALEIGLAGEPPALPKDLTLQCMVHELSEADFQNDSAPQPLLLLEFPGKEIPSFPAKIEGDFTVKSPFGKWQWEDAETLDVTPELTADVKDLVSRLHYALSDKALATVAGVVEIKTREMAKAFYIDPAQRLADQKVFFNDIFKDGRFAMEPLNTNDLEMVPMAHNRLFLAQHQGGAAALESTELSEGYNFSLPVMAAKISGQWRVVR